MLQQGIPALFPGDRRLDEWAPELEDGRIERFVIGRRRGEHEENVEKIRDAGRLGPGGSDASAGEDAWICLGRKRIARGADEPTVELPPEYGAPWGKRGKGRLGPPRGIKVP
jgi:hypothetical protein